MSMSLLCRLFTVAILGLHVQYLAAAEPRVLIPLATDSAAVWQYTTVKPGADWTGPGFDDSAWWEGKAGFGVTDYVTPPNTIGTPWTTSDIWLRKKIDVREPLDFASAGVVLRHDEDVELYVGGTLVFSVQGFNTKYDAYEFRQRLGVFLSLCDQRGLKVMLTLFDDCAFGSDEKLKNPTYGRQPEVLEGWYANGWTPSPGHDIVRDPTTWPRLEKYIKDIIGAFKDDSRVWVWDLYNEPTNGGLGNVSVPLTESVFRWARDVDPSQPLTVAQWNGNTVLNSVIFANSDVITFHDYGPSDALARHIEDIGQHGRPLINTEWLNRGRGSLVETCLPVFHKTEVGCMHWGLVNGKTQTDLAWGWRPGMGEPKVWQHDLFHGDAKPYRPEEIKLFRQRWLAGQNEQRTP